MSYQSNRGKAFVHPFTFYIVNFGVEDVIRAFREHHYTTSLENLFAFVMALDPAIKENLTKDIETMNQMRKANQSLTEDKLIEIMNKVYDQLHNAGYFLAAKMSPPTRATTLSDMEKKLEKAKSHGTH